jgi:DNA-directed RNA polymerase subunit RPC12/RpoP
VCAKRFIKSGDLRYGEFQSGFDMERNVSSLKFGIEGSALSMVHASSRCSACGEEFEKPLLAMVFSDFLVEEYYACPKCLSKVCSVERQGDVGVGEAEVDEGESLELEVEDAVEEAVGCAHHLGYLRRRPKNTPIPEGCFTCSKMIDCMSH